MTTESTNVRSVAVLEGAGGMSCPKKDSNLGLPAYYAATLPYELSRLPDTEATTFLPSYRETLPTMWPMSAIDCSDEHTSQQFAQVGSQEDSDEPSNVELLGKMFSPDQDLAYCADALPTKL